MMKYTPLVRIEMAPITSAIAAEAPIASPNCRKPLWTPWWARMPTA